MVELTESSEEPDWASLVGSACPELTKPEQNICSLVMSGLSVREAGSALYLAKSTVQVYLSLAEARLGVSNVRSLRAEIFRRILGQRPRPTA